MYICCACKRRLCTITSVYVLNGMFSSLNIHRLWPGDGSSSSLQSGAQVFSFISFCMYILYVSELLSLSSFCVAANAVHRHTYKHRCIRSHITRRCWCMLYLLLTTSGGFGRLLSTSFEPDGAWMARQQQQRPPHFQEAAYIMNACTQVLLLAT